MSDGCYDLYCYLFSRDVSFSLAFIDRCFYDVTIHVRG